MYVNLMRRLVIVLATLVAVICFVINIMLGGDFFYSAFMALCVLFVSSVIIMVAFQAVAQVLFKHLEEKRKVQKMMADKNLAQAQKKASNKK